MMKVLPAQTTASTQSQRFSLAYICPSSPTTTYLPFALSLPVAHLDALDNVLQIETGEGIADIGSIHVQPKVIPSIPTHKYRYTSPHSTPPLLFLLNPLSLSLSTDTTLCLSLIHI